ncbi:chromosomal replication initiator protein DnaA [bacterium]|jgi:chromosomal replication initiator protein|nr:chromosomal replication initiator protein DnaA [bacterium]
MSIKPIWDIILDSLGTQLSEPNFQIFSTSVAPVSYEGNILSLKLNNEFTRTWVKDKCEPIIKASLAETNYSNLVFDYIFEQIQEEEDDIPQMELFPRQSPMPGESIPKDTLVGVNQNFTFENFVVGNNNRFANAAALAVAKKPVVAYNPLFIYGSVGLGKTHLLHSIAMKIKELHPHMKILVVTSEHFTNDLINSLKDKRMGKFKDKYRQVDVLMVDDIQFIAGKEATQEEFFHTFNELHSNGKQIVFTSDRPPKDIPTLQERLRTRFGWGLIADIQPPELETRIAILRKKVEVNGLLISDEILHYVATQIPSNIRELEGALTRIAAHSSLLDTEITLSMASNVIQDLVGMHHEKPLTIGTIKRKAADYFSIPLTELTSKTRTKEVAYARQVAMYLSRELTNVSLPKIGENFGGRDHSTVMHACDKIKSLMESDMETRGIVQSLITSIRSAQE